MANYPISRALISVSDKTGIVDFARTLKRWSIEIISTGSTAKMLRSGGVDVMEIAHYTGSPEMMGGRVKSLHTKVLGGLLAVRDNPEHVKEMEDYDIPPIDMVVVNLHPFESAINKPDVGRDCAIDQIDIGGANMLRSAAKNHKYVAALHDPADYSLIVRKMEELNGALDDDTREYLAAKAFSLTAYYDSRIGAYLGGDLTRKFPDKVSTMLRKTAQLRYGANPSQEAALYKEPRYSEPAITTARKLSGKELSFNNLLDANTALELARDFDRPAVVFVKHTNPCGAAIDDDQARALLRAYEGDPLAAYGGVAAFNRKLTTETAELMCKTIRFIGVIVAPGFDGRAADILKGQASWGSRVRLLDLMCGDSVGHAPPDMDVERLRGGYLLQSDDAHTEKRDEYKTVSKVKATDAQLADLELAWTVAKHAKSNAIVLARDGRIIGVGAGQMKRSSSVTIALETAGERASGAVLASDAFIPYTETVKPAMDAGVCCIIHPGGSRNDENLIALADEANIALLVTGMRHFRH